MDNLKNRCLGRLTAGGRYGVNEDSETNSCDLGKKISIKICTSPCSEENLCQNYNNNNNNNNNNNRNSNGGLQIKLNKFDNNKNKNCNFTIEQQMNCNLSSCSFPQQKVCGNTESSNHLKSSKTRPPTPFPSKNKFSINSSCYKKNTKCPSSSYSPLSNPQATSTLLYSKPVSSNLNKNKSPGTFATLFPNNQPNMNILNATDDESALNSNYSISPCQTERSSPSCSIVLPSPPEPPLWPCVIEPTTCCDSSPQTSTMKLSCAAKCCGAANLAQTVEKICSGKNQCNNNNNNNIDNCNNDCQNNGNISAFIEEMNEIFLDRLCDVAKRVPKADCVKVSIYTEWVDLLNVMINGLVNAITTLETEATCRIADLEKLLEQETCNQNTSNSNNECELQNLKSDIANFLELIKRANSDCKFNFNGLVFKTVKQDTLIGDNCSITKSNSSISGVIQSCRNTEVESQPQTSNCTKSIPSNKDETDCGCNQKQKICSTSNFSLQTVYSNSEEKVTTNLNKSNTSISMNDRYETNGNCLQTLKGELAGVLRSLNCEARKSIGCQLDACQAKYDEMRYKIGIFQSKLKFVHKQLRNIIEEKEESCDSDQGYISQEDLEPEKSMLTCVSKRIHKIKDENKKLKCKVDNLCKDIESATTDCTTKSNILERNRKILDSVAKHLSGLCGSAISVQALLFDDDLTTADQQSCGVETDKTDCNRCPEITPFCEAIDKLEETLMEKECTINKINELREAMEKQLDCCEKNLKLERTHREKDIKTLKHQLCMAIKSAEGLEILKDKLSSALCTSEERNSEILKVFGDLEANNTQLAQDNNELQKNLYELNCDLVKLQERLEKSTTSDNYRKPLTPLQIPSPSQFLLTTTTNPTMTNSILSTSSASIPQQELNNINNNYHNYQPISSAEQPDIRRLSNEEHLEYRNIINDLTNELVDLTSQVSLAHDKFDNNDESKPFEKTLKEFEQQNDLLQKTIQALEKSNAEKDKIIAEKTANQHILKIKLSNFENDLANNNSKSTIKKLVEEIQQSTDKLRMIQSKCTCGAAKSLGSPMNREIRSTHEYPNLFQLLEQKTSELHKLQEQFCMEKTTLKKDILDLEDKNKRTHIKINALNEALNKKQCEVDELKTKVMKLSVSHVNEEIINSLRSELEKEKKLHNDQLFKCKMDVQNLRKHIDEQQAGLVKHTDTINQMEKQITNYRTQHENAVKENHILQKEVFNLKERLASSEGTERSLKEQIHKSQEELVNTKCDLQKINAYSEEIDNCKKNIQYLQNKNVKMIHKYNKLIEDYNELQENFSKISNLNNMYVGELEHFRKWQEEQTESDDMNEQRFQQMNEHIKALTEDREKLIENCNKMFRDTYLLGSELEKYKDDYEKSVSSQSNYIGDGDSLNETPEQIVNKMQKTAAKMYHTRIAWFEQINERRNSE